MFTLIIYVIFQIISLIFCYSVYRTARRIAKPFCLFPIWLVWMMVLPIIGYIFAWLMLAFGIAKSIRLYCAGKAIPLEKATQLFTTGLCAMVALLFSSPPILNIITLSIAVIALTIYWIQMIKIRHIFIHSNECR